MAQVVLARVQAKATTPVAVAQVRLAAVSITRTGTVAAARVAVASVKVRAAQGAKVTIARVQVQSHQAVVGTSDAYAYDAASKTWVPITTSLWDAATQSLV